MTRKPLTGEAHESEPKKGKSKRQAFTADGYSRLKRCYGRACFQPILNMALNLRKIGGN